MFNLNEVMLIGQLGQDPKVIQSKDEKHSFVVCKIATNETWSYENKTENHVEWHTIEINQPRAKSIADFCKKGDQLLVRGRIRTREWETADGKKQQQTVIKATQVHLLRKKIELTEDALPADADVADSSHS